MRRPSTPIATRSAALKREHTATTLLRVNAVEAAVAKKNYPLRDTTLSQGLPAFMKAGAEVIPAGSCMRRTRLARIRSNPIRRVTVSAPNPAMAARPGKDGKMPGY